MSKQILFDQAARRKLADGVEKLANAVAATLGPRGRNVVIQRAYGSPTVTKDGVTVAKEIELKDPFENMGAKLVMEVASKTNDEAGDGTTSSTVIANAIIKAGMKLTAHGNSNQDIKRGIEKATAVAVKWIKDNSTKVTNEQDLRSIATISANHDSVLGDLIATAVSKVGDDGVVTIEPGQGLDTYVSYVDGLKFNRGWLSPYFVNKREDMTTEYADARILLCPRRINNTREIVNLLEQAHGKSTPIVIVAEDFDNEVLSLLVINYIRGTLKCVAVKAPEFGERRKAMMEDLATVTGGIVIDDEAGTKLIDVKLEQLGVAKRIIIDKDTTTIVDGAGKKEDIQAKIDLLRKQADHVTTDYERETIQMRLAKLVGGVAQIHVGGHTEAEITEKRYRVEDALNATRAAKAEGIVPGGGITYLRASQAIRKSKFKKEEQLGASILAEALESPIVTIAENAGKDGQYVLALVQDKELNHGYNALTDKYEDLLVAGVIDPAKVARCAIQNAASVAGLMLTTNTLVAEIDNNKDKDSIS